MLYNIRYIFNFFLYKFKNILVIIDTNIYLNLIKLDRNK